jgi:hypothetical protein
MKFWLSMLLIALAALGCSQKQDKTASRNSTTGSDEVLCRKAAEQLVSMLSRDFKRELLTAMKEGGAVNAIKVCSEKAPLITDAYVQDSIVIVKRVSDKIRNVNNRATKEEESILARFADTTGTPPAYISEWIPDDSGKTYRYYQPIRVGQLCLNCHGDRDKISPAVLEVLEKSYPEDLATGYEVGDLRGMFVVEMKWPQARSFVQKLLTDSEL